MSKIVTLTVAAAFAAMFMFAAGPANAQKQTGCSGVCTIIKDADLGSDFATFFASGDNLGPGGTSGALCSVTNAAKSTLVVAPWRWYVSIANNTGGALSATVKYFDGDTISYPIPGNTSFAFTTAAGGGSIGNADIALRLVADEGLRGSVSVRGPKKDDKVVFCISCDDPASGFDGDDACDSIIPD